MNARADSQAEKRRFGGRVVGARDTEIRLARVPPHEIGFLNSLIESYEGIGMLRTRDPKQGVVEFWMVPDFKDVFLELIEELRRDIPIVWLPKTDRDPRYGIIDGVGYDPQNPHTEEPWRPPGGRAIEQ